MDLASASAMSDRYVIFLDGIGTQSPSESLASCSHNRLYLGVDFCDIRSGLQSLGVSHFVYFSYSALDFNGAYCQAWDGTLGCGPGGRLSPLDLSPTYSQDDTKHSIVDEAKVLDWLIRQVLAVDNSAQVDIVGYSLGGVIAAYWGAHDGVAPDVESHVHGITLLESPVGGIPLAESALGGGCSKINPACGLDSAFLQSFFGQVVLQQLELPAAKSGTSIVASLSDAGKNFPVTSVVSTLDYMVNDVPMPVCSNPLCTSSDSAVFGIGSQYWSVPEVLHLAALGQPSQGSKGLATQAVGVLDIEGWILANHGAPLHDPQTVALVESAISGCQFVLGFQTLHDLDPTDVGACVDNQAFAANGDAIQHTTKGLPVWRKHPQVGTRNWTAFTNGAQTWINGPSGLVARPNFERYSWETNPDGLPLADGGDTMPPVPLRFSGGGYHHGAGLVINPDGTGSLGFRAWVQCGPGVQGPCDQGNTWGIQGSLKFDHASGDTLYGTVLTTNDPKTIPLGPVRVVVRPYGHMDVLYGDEPLPPSPGFYCGGPYWKNLPSDDFAKHWDCGA